MSDTKNGNVGSKKSAVVYLLFGMKCGLCNTKLAFLNEAQIEHITAQQTFVENGMAIDCSLGNLALACKTCNSEKGKNGIEFYAERNQKSYKFILTLQALTNGLTDLRQILKLNLRNIDGQLLTMKNVTAFCDGFAQRNLTIKFAYRHREGKFYQQAIA